MTVVEFRDTNLVLLFIIPQQIEANTFGLTCSIIVRSVIKKRNNKSN